MSHTERVVDFLNTRYDYVADVVCGKGPANKACCFITVARQIPLQCDFSNEPFHPMLVFISGLHPTSSFAPGNTTLTSLSGDSLVVTNT
jgi:hypothetical protein